MGILTALRYLSTAFENNRTAANIVVYTDSMSALQSLEKSKPNQTELNDIILEANKIQTAFAIRLVLQWIPGHTNIPGNDKADKLAKQGSNSEQPQRPATLQTARKIIKENYKEDWMNLWSRGTTGRVVYQHMNMVKKRDPIRQMTRKEQTTIFRLRTQHIPLNYHLNRINPEHHPNCQLCDHPHETVEHFLFDCPKLQDFRQQLLPPIPDVDNTLYSSLQQLKQTATYYSMALARRAKAQEPLD